MPDNTVIDRKLYSSDITPEQWAIVAPLFPIHTGRGRKRRIPLQEIISAIFYINTNGCKWVDLPHDFPPATSVSYHYCKQVDQKRTLAAD